jgi:nitroreductase
MDFESVIVNRKSTRLFGRKELEDEKLNAILEAGRIAPTAKNNQPIKIYVVKSNEGLKKIDKASPCRYGSSTVLIICGDTNKAFSKDDHSTYEIDASIVTTHMMLEATNQGVDNIWIDLFDRKVIREEFEIPENLIPVAMLPLGYKSKLCPPSPKHNSRIKLKDMIEYK